ncbi:MAG: TIGR02186 family protein [Alphaproteobacteria bacterium]|nr:TIGR02186 family protein [Alphaproteobacteria bacterium]
MKIFVKIKLIFLLTILSFNVQASRHKKEFIEIHSHKLNIPVSIGFRGNTINIYGTTNIDGNIVVIIKGKNIKYRVNKQIKKKIFWVNKQITEIKNIPSIYMISTNKYVSYDRLNNFNFGLNSISPIIDNDKLSKDEKKEIWNKVKKLKQTKGNYHFKINHNNLKDRNSLFKATFNLPPNIKIGEYDIYAFVIKKNGDISDITQQKIFINRKGIIDFIYNKARYYPNLYGLIVVLLSLLIGLVSGYRKN